MRRAVLLTLALVLLPGLAACTVESEPGQSQSPSGDDLPTNLMRDDGAAARALRDLEREIGASPARLRDLSMYTEYVVVEAQDPTNTEHIDSYTWRDDQVGPAEPVMLSGPQEEVESSLFPSTAIRWRRIPELVRTAESRVLHAKPIRIEEPVTSYISIERSPSPEDDGRIEMRFQISGPRRSGYVEMTASGEVTEVYVG